MSTNGRLSIFFLLPAASLVGCGPTPTAEPTLAPGAERVRDRDSMLMVHVPAGEFLMGSADAQIQAAVAQCVADRVNESSCKTWIQAESP